MANLKVWAIACAIFFLPITITYSAQAQVQNIRQLLEKTPTLRLTFAPGTVGAVIQATSNKIYLLNAKSGQTLTLSVNNMGAGARLAVYGVDGKPISQVITGFDKKSTITVKLPKSGDYYIVAWAGSTNNVYDFTIRIDG